MPLSCSFPVFLWHPFLFFLEATSYLTHGTSYKASTAHLHRPIFQFQFQPYPSAAARLAYCSLYRSKASSIRHINIARSERKKNNIFENENRNWITQCENCNFFSFFSPHTLTRYQSAWLIWWLYILICQQFISDKVQVVQSIGS